MSDDPAPGRYESEPRRVRGGSGTRWLAIWAFVAVAVASIGVAGTMMSPPGPPPPAASVDEAMAATPTRPDVAPSPSPSPRPRATTPLVVRSTDFYGNGGAAYYGIGGRLIRALAPSPAATQTPDPGDDAE